MPAMPIPEGPISAYARTMKPYVLGVLIFQTVMLMIRVFWLTEIMPGFIMLIAVAIGWYAYKEDMHITFICYWGMMCLFNGAFDLVRWIDMTVHYRPTVFSSKAPMTYNIESLVLILIPVSVLLAAPVSWRLYKDATEGTYEREVAWASSARRPGQGEREPLWNSQTPAAF